MDSPKYIPEFSELPEDLQLQILSQDPSTVRSGRELSKSISSGMLWKRIEQDILLIPTMYEVEDYLYKHPGTIIIGYDVETDTGSYFDVVTFKFVDEFDIGYNGYGIRRVDQYEINDSDEEIRLNASIGPHSPLEIDLLSGVGYGYKQSGYYKRIQSVAGIIYDLSLMNYVLRKRLQSFDLDKLTVDRETAKYLKQYLINLVDYFENPFALGFILVANGKLFNLESVKAHPFYSDDRRTYNDPDEALIEMIDASNKKVYDELIDKIDNK